MKLNLIFSLLVTGLFACKGQKSASSDSAKNSTKKTETSSSFVPGQISKLTLDSGDVQGTEVIVDGSASATPIDLTLARTGAPAEFKDAAGTDAAGNLIKTEAASAAIVVDETSGKVVNGQLLAPMTIRIPVGGLELASIPKTIENICVFLKTKQNDLFVFRQNDDGLVSVGSSDGKSFVTVRSRYLGTYQLRYCGALVFPNIKTVGLEDGIAAKADESIFNFTFDPSKFFNIDNTVPTSGVTYKTCFILGTFTDSDYVWKTVSGDLTTGNFSFSFNMSDFSKGSPFFEILVREDGCDDIAGFGQAYQTPTDALMLYRGAISLVSLQERNSSYVFGLGGNLAAAETQLVMGHPTSAVQPFDVAIESSMCVFAQAMVGDTAVGYTMVKSSSINWEASGNLKYLPIQVPVPANYSNQNILMQLVIGHDGLPAGCSTSSESDESQYVLLHTDPISDGQTKYYLSPVEISVDSLTASIDTLKGTLPAEVSSFFPTFTNNYFLSFFPATTYRKMSTHLTSAIPPPEVELSLPDIQMQARFDSWELGSKRKLLLPYVASQVGSNGPEWDILVSGDGVSKWVISNNHNTAQTLNLLVE